MKKFPPMFINLLYFPRMLHKPTILLILIARFPDLYVNYWHRLSHCVQPAYMPDIYVSHPSSRHVFTLLTLNTRRDLHADICRYICEQQRHRNAGGCGAQRDCRGTNEHTRPRLERRHIVGEVGICKITAYDPGNRVLFLSRTFWLF